MIKQLLNSVITKYHDLPVSRRSIICLSLRLRQIIYLLATDKSRYFAQPRPIIVNYWMRSSMIARIIMAKVCDIFRNQRLSLITQTKALTILAIKQKTEVNNYYFIVHLRVCKNKDAYKKLNMLHQFVNNFICKLTT